MENRPPKTVKVEIKVNGNVLTMEEVKFLTEVIETQKIEVESLTDEAKKNTSIKKTFKVISSLARKLSPTPSLSL